MKKQFLLLFFSCVSFLCIGQSSDGVSPEVEAVSSAIFLPALEIGYMNEQTPSLGGGLLIKTSVEYRTKKRVFFKLNFDASSTEYKLDAVLDETNIIEGTTSLEDLLLGIGYRMGKDKIKWFVLNQTGMRFYNYPKVNNGDDKISILQESNTLGFNRFSVGIEYYLDDKIAITLESFFASALKQQDFWEDKRSSFGVTIGVTTALF